MNVTSTLLTTGLVTQYNNSDFDTRKSVEAVLRVGLTTLVCLIGVPANVVNCLVFCSQGLRDRMNICLFSLALADFAFLTCMFLVNPVSVFIEWWDESTFEIWFRDVYMAVVGIAYGFRSTSSFITMVIAVERCVCVVFPLRASALISSRVIATLIVASFIVFQACNVLLPLSYFDVLRITQGQRRRVILITKFYYDNQKVVFVRNIFFGFPFPVGIFLIVFVVTTITIRKLNIAFRWREKTSSVNNDSFNHQRSLTVMLVIAACVYIGTMLPFVVRETVFLANNSLLESNLNSDLYLVLCTLADWISLINNCIHCFIYYSRSSRYKLHFKHILRQLGMLKE